MPFEIPKCKITVLKRTINQDLIDEYLDEDTSKNLGQGFCAWAWADIRRDIFSVAAGADMPGMKQRGSVITGCTDWFRPVIFKVERIS